jgi:hypothetical protein
VKRMESQWSLPPVLMPLEISAQKSGRSSSRSSTCSRSTSSLHKHFAVIIIRFKEIGATKNRIREREHVFAVLACHAKYPRGYYHSLLQMSGRVHVIDSKTDRDRLVVAQMLLPV